MKMKEWREHGVTNLRKGGLKWKVVARASVHHLGCSLCGSVAGKESQTTGAGYSCRRVPGYQFVDAYLSQDSTAVCVGLTPLAFHHLRATHKAVGQELVRNQGVSTRRWAVIPHLWGPPAAPRSPADLAWVRKGPVTRCCHGETLQES